MARPLHRQWYDAGDSRRLHRIGYYSCGTTPERLRQDLRELSRSFRDEFDKQNNIPALFRCTIEPPRVREGSAIKHVLGAVYRLVKKIPRGRVTTYGDLAKALQVPGGARVVGYAMAGMPERPRHSVASRGRRGRAPDHPRAVRQHAAAIARIGRRRGRRASLDMQRYGWLPKKPTKKRSKARGGKRRKVR